MRALTVSLLMSGLVACGGVTSKEPPTPEPIREAVVGSDTSAKSASLLRRLAEAADGFRDGEPRWVVIHREGARGHHEVRGVFMTLSEANFEAKRAGPEYAVFGPFVTLDDPSDESSGPRDVVEVLVRLKDGETLRFTPDSVDALFWTLAAFDKFIVPYLARVSGAAYAAEQRELYRRGESRLARSAVVPHKAGSF